MYVLYLSDSLSTLWTTQVSDLHDEWTCSVRTWDLPGRSSGRNRKPNVVEYCNDGKINSRKQKAWERILAARNETMGDLETNSEAKSRGRSSSAELDQPPEKKTKITPVESEDSVNERRTADDLVSRSSVVDAQSDTNFNAPKAGSEADKIHVNHEPTPEGASKQRARGLVEIAQQLSYVPKYYAAHVLRGVWQDEQVSKHKRALADKGNVGRVAMLTIDMKSKTVPGKNRAEQGYNMGAKGMSLQGGMLNFYEAGKSELQTHYVDLIYAQSSNQHLEEAMSGLSAQLGMIRRKWPSIQEIIIVSDKCSNFNAYGQV